MGVLQGDRIQVTFRGLCFGQRILMVRMFEALGDGIAGQTVAQDLENIITEVRAGGVKDIETPYLACLPPQYSLESVRAQVLRPIRSAFRETFTPGVIGTNANAATVACDSAGIIVRGPLAGRRQRGTVKIGPAPDGASAAGLLTPAYRALLQALSAKFVGAFTPAGWGATLVAPVLWHVPTNTTTNIHSAFVPTDSRVMRRRVVGRGE